MGGKMDKSKGRIEEATGVITENDRLKPPGQTGSSGREGEGNIGKGSREGEGKSRAGGCHEERLTEKQPGRLTV